ncbi:ABC transporter permease protein YnjC [Vibrio orientalis CIP 102891 = ATCC 33934]|uniref:ABC transporter permease protein YnjC n=2 Tax=Vibrio orientalis CIP 102891 = ATCC 33934 TaxID=675816 RepID=A0ABP2GVC3_VIBOR|nr:ABC transporter permease protein YnjC [Vibrio orientalis CIP 102891 = ATCC 33934]
MILPALYLLLIVICILPTIPGLLGVVMAALGYIPPVGLTSIGLDGFTQVFNWSGVSTSISLTLYSTIVSSYLACFITFMILQSCWNKRFWRVIETTLSPLLAMPHVAFAIGFAFLFSPTGIGARALFHLFGYDPNDQSVTDLALLIKDPYAIGLIVMLTFKEIPFLLLMSIPIIQQLKVERIEKVSASLGYSRAQTWWKCVLPQWLSKIRFPMFAVIAYSLSVVDVALIIGPTNPPTFAVLVWQWFNDPDLALLPRASAGAVVLFIIATLLIGFARAFEWILLHGWRSWQTSGRFGLELPGRGLFGSLVILTGLMIPLTVLWSFAQRWRFPDLLPTQYSSRFWQYEWSNILDTLSQSLSIAVICASLALILAVIAHEYRLRHRWTLPHYLIAIPMLIPQLSILFGIQVATLYIDSSAYLLWVCWAHVFFVFPYVYLSLDGPWKSYDSGLTRVGLSLGKSPIHVWLKIKLPILLPAVMFAWAIGVSVSLAQYLPTLILGAGRISTITTEAVALSSGFDRRVTAIYALWQALLPLLFFSIAILLGHFHAKYRRLSIKGLLPNESLSRKPHRL